MCIITDNLCEAVGRITADPAMLSLYAHDRNRGIREMQIDLSAREIEYLDEYVKMLTSGSEKAREVLATVLQSAERTVQN